jgi:hypothetical protein
MERYGAKPKLAIEYGISLSWLSTRDWSISAKLFTWSFDVTKIENTTQNNRVNMLAFILIV